MDLTPNASILKSVETGFADVLKTMSRTLEKFSEYFSLHRPDLIIVLGDRFEIFSVAQAALVHNIPVAISMVEKLQKALSTMLSGTL